MSNENDTVEWGVVTPTPTVAPDQDEECISCATKESLKEARYNLALTLQDVAANLSTKQVLLERQLEVANIISHLIHETTKNIEYIEQCDCED